MREWLYGRNPVLESLRAGRRTFFQLNLAEGNEKQTVLVEIENLCRQNKIPIRTVKKDWFNTLTVSDHQGVALEASAFPYRSLEDMLALAQERNEPPLILLLDTLQDPQNLGGLLRTAEAVGVHGVCLPFRRTATVTPSVVNRSSGASEHLLIAQANLSQIITRLKEEGLWIIGLEKGSTAQRLDKVRLDGPIAVVVGSEGTGMRELVRKSCDLLVELPMRGEVSSLNASIAGSIVLYKVWEKRGF